MMTSAFPLLLALTMQQVPDSLVTRARDAIRPLVDSASLAQAGYTPLTFGPVRDLTPFQGQHWLAMLRIAANLPVDLSKPTFVMYLPLRDSLIPVGVAYSRRIGGTTAIPTELAGTPVEWHTHVFCSNVPGEGRVLADGVDDCRDRGGTPTVAQIAMVHTWTAPNPDGPNAHDNPSLPFIATGLKPPAHPTRDDRLFGIALGESYGAKLPEAHRIERVAQRDGTGQLLTQHRAALRDLVPQLVEAERKGDKAKYESLRKKTISTWNALLSTYHALSPTPEIGRRLDLELAQLLGEEMHHHGG